jgi:hypothetical protein
VVNGYYSLISGINKNKKARELYKNFALLLQEFFIENTLQIDNYAHETLKQKSVQLQFIEFLFAHQEQLTDDPLIHCDEINKLVTPFVQNDIANHFNNHNQLIILGLGLGCAEYEKALSQYIIQSGIARNCLIYGYDPYAEQAQGVTYLNNSELNKGDYEKPDLIIARYVLHHIDTQYRQAILTSIFQNSQKNSLALFIEEAFLVETCSYQSHIYCILHQLFDIYMNFYFNNFSLKTNLARAKEIFFLKYIDNTDLINIKSLLKKEQMCSIKQINFNFPDHYLIKITL